MNNPTIKKLQPPITGYKAFKRDDKGLYTDGMGNNKTRTYWRMGECKTIKEGPELCAKGFHFFTSLCFALDYLEPGNEIREVTALGDILADTFKLVTNSIRIGKKVSKKQIKKALVDKNENSGDWNSGNRNSGDWNSGDCNSGNWNSGSGNSGIRNSGNWNSGNWNSGSGNSGNRNSGNCNSGNGYINYFCTDTKYFLFDTQVSKIPNALLGLDLNWLNLTNKTYKEAWKDCPEHILNILRNIPEFKEKKNMTKFKEITGIDL